MKFENVVKIDGNFNIKVSETNLYAGPMNIKEIEYFEEQLINNEEDYLLAQVETTDECPNLPSVFTSKLGERPDLRFVRGYCLFMKPNGGDE